MTTPHDNVRAPHFRYTVFHNGRNAYLLQADMDASEESSRANYVLMRDPESGRLQSVDPTSREELDAAGGSFEPVCDNVLGILGTIQLLADTYLLVITQAREVVRFQYPGRGPATIWAITKLRALPFQPQQQRSGETEEEEQAGGSSSSSSSSPSLAPPQKSRVRSLSLRKSKSSNNQEEEEDVQSKAKVHESQQSAHKMDQAQLESMFEFLESGDVYFSLDHDVTQSSVRLEQQSAEEDESPLYESADKRFFWNRHLCRAQIALGLHRTVLPVMSGFVTAVRSTATNSDTGKETEFLFVLISRRGCKRTGARYFARGISPQGHVANFVETEQLVFVGDQGGTTCATKVLSHVQVRGSMPHFWIQPPIGLKPKPIVVQDPYARIAFDKHFDSLLELYGPQMCVNLVNMHGKEMGVGDQFETLVRLRDSEDVQYTWFDFHRECAHNRYENLAILLERIRDQVESHGYTVLSGDEHGCRLEAQQQGCVRTNCIDCLDRTNVVQSAIAMHVLLRQCREHELLGAEAVSFNDPHGFGQSFKTVWADNADSMSMQYAGTGALKTDYTRTGKRSNRGMLQDGINSVKRFFINTYQDGERQRMLDLLLGRFEIEAELDLDEAEDVENGVFDATLVSGKNGAEKVLLFVGKHDHLVTYNYASGATYRTPLREVRVVERVTNEPTFLHLRVNTSPNPLEVSFRSVAEREQFVARLLGGSVRVQNTFLSVPQTEQELLRAVSVCTVSWNMAMMPPPENMGELLPEGHLVYAIGVQESYYTRNKSETTLSVHAHFAYLVAKHLGKEYAQVHRVSQGLTSLVLVVHESLMPLLSNVVSSSVKVGAIDETSASSSGMPSASASSSSSPATVEVTAGGDGEDVGEEEDEEEEVVVDELVEGAVAVRFELGITSFCVINFHLQQVGSAEARLVEMQELVQELEEGFMDMSSLSEYDVGTEHDVTVWMGRNVQGEATEETQVTVVDGLAKEFVKEYRSRNCVGYVSSQQAGLFGYENVMARVGVDSSQGDTQLWSDHVLCRHHDNVNGMEVRALEMQVSGVNQPVAASMQLNVALPPWPLVELREGPSEEGQEQEQEANMVTYVEVTEMSAHGLNAADVGGKADPFVVLYSPLSVDRATSSVCKNTLDPTWDEETLRLQSYVVGGEEHLRFLGRQKVSVCVWDYDTLRANSVMGLGNVNLEAAAMAAANGNTDVTPFQCELALDGAHAGMLSGNIRLVTETVAELEARVSQESSKAGKKKWSGLSLRGSSKPEANKKLYVRVLEGKDLAAKDSNGLSDPFVQLQLGKKSAKTSVVDKNLNPTWNESFEFEVTQLHGKLTCTLWDRDRLLNDYMGTVVVPLMTLRDQMPHDEWHAVTVDKKHRKHEVSGKLHLEVRLKDVESLVCMLCTRSVEAQRAAIVPLFALLDLQQPYYKDLSQEDYTLISKHAVRQLYRLQENEAFQDMREMITQILSGFDEAMSLGGDVEHAGRFSMRKRGTKRRSVAIQGTQ